MLIFKKKGLVPVYMKIKCTYIFNVFFFIILRRDTNKKNYVIYLNIKHVKFFKSVHSFYKYV